ncbi:MAG: class I SAM-dependent methyltransferase [Bacteroidales bacterium]|jgi:SAM-dependent methyltransferase|nr:class I SAM-dependent methyltransferase [Bacteroidales bacterium]
MADKFEPAFDCIDHLVSRRPFRVLRCSSCGFLFTQNIPEPGDILSYYDSPDYISHTGGKKGISDLLYSLSRTIMLGKKARTIKMFTGLKSGSLLDIGAGAGFFVRKMTGRGWKAEGVELSDTARRYALMRNGVELREELSGLPADSGTFDAATMWHVLEHLHQPDRYLDTVFNLLGSGGILVIAAPNPQSADARHYGSSWAAFDVPRHLWHFDRSNLTRFVSEHGFRLVSVRRMPFDSFYIPVLSERNRNKRFPMIAGLTKGCLFWLESLVLKSRSSSLMYVFRKE